VKFSTNQNIRADCKNERANCPTRGHDDSRTGLRGGGQSVGWRKRRKTQGERTSPWADSGKGDLPSNGREPPVVLKMWELMRGKATPSQTDPTKKSWEKITETVQKKGRGEKRGEQAPLECALFGATENERTTSEKIGQGKGRKWYPSNRRRWICGAVEVP